MRPVLRAATTAIMAATSFISRQLLRWARTIGSDWRRYAVLAVLCLCLVGWLRDFGVVSRFDTPPAGTGFGADFGMFLGASQVIENAGNPYSPDVLYRTERLMLHRQGLPITPRQSVVRVGNPPLFLWSLHPLLRFPFRIAATAWVLAMLLFSLLGLLATLCFLGWRRKLLPCVLFLMMPQVVLNLFHANNVAILFAAVACSLAFARRFPAVAGALLGIAWLKPQVGLPIVLLVTLFHTPHPRRLLAGFAGATASLIVLTVATTGLGSLRLWIAGMIGYSHDIAGQTAIPSIAGLYVQWASPRARIGLTIALLVCACAITVLQWLRVRQKADVPFHSVAWLWFAWFLVTPYTHVTDEILLTIPILAILGRDAVRMREPLASFSLLALFFAPLPGEWSLFALGFPVLVLVLADWEDSWRSRLDIAAPSILLALSTISHRVSIPLNGQCLALLAVTVCLVLSTREPVANTAADPEEPAVPLTQPVVVAPVVG